MICAVCGQPQDDGRHPYVAGTWGSHDFRFTPAYLSNRFRVVSVAQSDEYGSWSDWAIHDSFLNRYAFFGDSTYARRTTHEYRDKLNNDARVVGDLGWEPSEEVEDEE